MSRIARQLVQHLAGDPRRREELFASQSWVVRAWNRGADPYEVLGEPTAALRRVMLRRFGPELVAALETVHRDHRVTEAMVETFWAWTRSGEIVGTYDELKALRSASRIRGIGAALHADHLLEARLHRMVRDGVAGHTARSVRHAQVLPSDQRVVEEHLDAWLSARGDAIGDGLCVLTPSTEVFAYRFARALRRHTGTPSAAAWFYPHLGDASKTARMAVLLPYHLEGMYSLKEMLDATLWVTTRMFHLPRALAPHIRDDLVKSVMFAVQNDPRTAELVVGGLRRRTGRYVSPDSEDALRDALRSILPVGELPNDFLDTWRFRAPIVRPETYDDALALLIPADVRETLIWARPTVSP